MSSSTGTLLANRKSLEPYIPDDVLFYDHQISGVRWMAKKGSFLCADEMGTGKSVQALTTFAIDVKMGWANQMIVVCPVTLKDNWADEIEKFTTFKYLILGTHNGRMLTPQKRTEQLIDFKRMDGPKILIVNYEQVTAHLAELNALAFDIRVFDEAHYLQNHKAKRTKAGLALYGRRTFLLTGSPMLNHVNGLWTLLHMVSPVEFPNYYSFVNRYAVFGGYKDKQIIGVKNERELVEKLQNHQIRRLKKDVLNLKEPQYIQIRVDLHPEQRKLYEQAMDDMEISIPGSPTPMEIENALTKFLRLKQICDTTACIEGYEDYSYKLDRAVEMAHELTENGHPVVMFTQFRDPLDCAASRCEALGIPTYILHGDIPIPDRVPVIKEWEKASQPGVLICMIQIAGIGLNMTHAEHMIFIDKLFVPMLNKQAVDRLHRIGASETQSVQVYEMICKNTIENRVEQILKVKKKLFDAIVEESDFKKRLVEALLHGGGDFD